ncbi:MAG: phosphoglucosamine mutase [Acidimicrobiales bacterium]|jgi:phosphoglucosamine mutase
MLRFGTDGVRGLANADLSPELVMALGRAGARALSGPAAEGRRRFIVGRDTRWSGPLLQAALSAGLAAEGVDVVDVGVLPTPAVAFLSSEQGAPAAVISASHNPYGDNGVKFFAAGGTKLSDDVEDGLEAELEALLETHERPGAPTRAGVGRISPDLGALARYEHYVLSCLEGRHLHGLRVALDCANGAAYLSAPQVFASAGAEIVSVLAAEPDGANINDGCGSTDPRRLAETVVDKRADLGLAFDGDADRVIAVDASGNVVDGDRLLALFATDLAQRGLLVGGTVVVTVMTNLGFHEAMAAAGVNVHTVGVGDRYVLEALDAKGWALGGEQSGHIVFRALATTGDGVLSGLLLADLVTRNNTNLADMAAAALRRFPQVLRNVAVANRDGLAEAAAVWAEVQAAERSLGQQGRVLLRPSGTEPLVRVMVEAPTQEAADAAAERIVSVLHTALGGTAGL